MNFDTKKKKVAVLSVLIKKFENMFQDWKKKKITFDFLYTFDSNFSQHKFITCKFSNGMYRVVIR